MKIDQFVFNSFQVNANLVTSNGKSILFDAPNSSDFELQEIIDRLKANKSELCAVILTHGHVDHIVGCSALIREFNVPVYLHNDDLFLIDNAPQMAAMFGFPWEEKPEISNIIDTEKEFDIEGFKFSALHVPGHSPGSLVYYFKEEKILIAGDVLFNGSIGRTDLPGGNHNDLIKGIKEKLLVLPDDIKVLPGHGQQTSIGLEKKQNPFL